MTTGRLAPTPSGLLHLGNARSLLLAWLWARSAHGRVILRIEDIDTARCNASLAQSAIEDLQWLGLTCDNQKPGGGVSDEFMQSARTELYRQKLNALIDAGLAYPCTCTRKDIEESASAPHGDDGPVYPGTCRGRWQSAEHARAETGREPAWRFLWDSTECVLQDAVHGQVAVNPGALGDFVLWRRDDLPSYQLAVTVDDALHGVTQVLRGRDLLSSTARQLALYSALKLHPPAQWAHVPFIQDPTGRRMAKRSGDLSLQSLREHGTDARKVVGFLAWTAGLQSEPTPATAEALVSSFRIEKVAKADYTLGDADLR